MDGGGLEQVIVFAEQAIESRLRVEAGEAVVEGGAEGAVRGGGGIG